MQCKSPSSRKKHLYNTSDAGRPRNGQGIGAPTVVAKTSIPEVAGILDPPHFYVSAT